jgi:uncharacterized protein (DUF58 family)
VTPLLDPVALRRLANLELRARAVVEGALSGMHRSPHHGSSVEFAEHKEYAPGDEIKHIDWKAYGKLDRYYVKRFEEETELRCYLCIDTSASMGYGAPGPTKLEYARTLAASLGYLLLRQQDHVGLISFGASLSGYLPPRSRAGHLSDLLGALEAAEPQGQTDLPRAIGYASEVAHRRSLIVFFSDLLGSGVSDPHAPTSPVHLFRGLRARRHDVVVFHLLHPDELQLPFDGPTRFLSMEDDAELLANPGEVRAAYLDEMQRFLDTHRRGLGEGDVEYHLVDTSRPPAEALLALLDGPFRRGHRGPR